MRSNRFGGIVVILGRGIIQAYLNSDFASPQDEVYLFDAKFSSRMRWQDWL